MIELTTTCINWIKSYFEKTNGKVAVVGISGGKDSTVCAALCVRALGKENVIGVLMPNGYQNDIKDSYRVCEFLEIEYLTINIRTAYNSIISDIENQCSYPLKKTNKISKITKQTEFNLAPRLRMASLYAVAQSIPGGRVCNTSNMCESYIGYGTLWGDTVGDFSPLGNCVISEVKEMGYDLGLPKDLIDKAPADGLTGKTDEDVLGFTYKNVEKCIIHCSNDEYSKIINKHIQNKFKSNMINIPKF